ncbi:Ribosomal protein S8e [Blastocystis hominis]|uniref:40S ribosomal protein S8 n=1 Tax=Blastocystis hominis TaxID=12968 RepID=D8LWI7_BLAHO|nr:Ribosomal protein S8e [Blastocystis hominis]XP_012895193.1 Ribosomal protein S8e [Blastocystis hominis]CBK20176.2 Ribosomal protein S8e [Blastocystis hominis]CBK21145.2 Ribosomal protein S8e [Blastocystis hominis]|eukprot:XP_012894224.1 Ribosomal protein S8e [Blastocystis hominis]
MTKLGAKRIYLVRCRGGNIKHRAIRLDTGSFSWTGEAFSAKTKILNIVYNASNNELVRTNTIVKGCIVSIDATPFKAWFEKHYSCKIGAKGEVTKDDLTKLEGVSKSNLAKLQKLQDSLQEQKEVIDQLASGKILARISSRPGQCGRADGYILEDEELAFYHKKINQKKK